MDSEQRPDSGALLVATQKEEARQHRGKLKIFFGMVAGVGKTYAMLESARQRLADGVNVVIGYVETHHRTESEGLIEGLTIIPRKKVEYRGITLEEMDIDAVLARHPQLVLVDELAHSNAPGSRHPKRYQDVLELLDAGIDVWTTINVQHLQSRADAVRQITGITIHETVPDSVFDTADEIELIDLAPEELLKRLEEGKVYLPDQADLAAKNFFRKGNLTALREMSLRLTAERVDHQLQDYMQVKQISGPWKSVERLMVAVSPSPLSERLVRWTRRMSYSLEADWIAVYVEPPNPLSPEAQARLSHNLSLARELGGEVLMTSDNDIVKAILRVARQRNVTQIVVGKPSRSLWQALLAGRSPVNRLIQNSGDIDVYVVTGDKTESAQRRSLPQPIIHSGIGEYLIALAVVCLVLLLGVALDPIIGYRTVAVALLFTVMLLAIFLGRGPVLFAGGLSALLWDFLFIPPHFTLLISTFEDVSLFAMYFVTALVTGILTGRFRLQEKAARRREANAEALYTLANETTQATTMDALLSTAINKIGHIFDAEVGIILAGPSGDLFREPYPASTLTVTEKELSVANWAFENGKPAGRFTNTLPTATAQYIPMLTPGGTVGVIGVHTRQPDRLAMDQEIFLQTFVSQIGLVIEHELLHKKAEQTAVLEESERLYATLFDSISHELKTPLATIAGATSGLLDDQINSNPAARQAMGENLQEATERLNRLVDNLLDMSRLESGQLKLNLEWCDVSDLINICLNRVEKPLAAHVVITDIAANLPLIRIDFVLMEQVLVNLLHNAAFYTPPGTHIRLQAKTDGTDLLLIVADRGPGLPPDSVNRVFDKFYRAPGAAAGGTGLGLSICRGLVTAHHGTLIAENRAHGGARFTIRLALAKEIPQAPQELRT